LTTVGIRFPLTRLTVGVMVISLAAGCQHKVDGFVRMFLLVK